MTSLMAGDLYAQVDKREVRSGNRDFRDGNWREAEIDYRKALVKDSLSVAGNYNLASALYRDGNYEEAHKALERLKDIAPMTPAAADYFYNLGDVALARQDYQTAVDAFAQSLLRRPDDLAAKENFIYAKKKLEDQQNRQNQQNDQQNDQNNEGQNDQEQDQNQNQDQDKDQDRKDDQKDDQDKNQDQSQNDQKDKPKPEPKPEDQPKITPQAAQQMLQAIQAKEKETQDKVQKEKAEALKARQKEKNW